MTCAACHMPVCSHPDAVYAGIHPISNTAAIVAPHRGGCSTGGVMPPPSVAGGLHVESLRSRSVHFGQVARQGS